jgi:hypothetical protein
MDWGDNMDPWELGVHLFSVHFASCYDSEGTGTGSTSTLATAVIQPSLRRINATDVGKAALWFKTKERLTRESVGRTIDVRRQPP